LIDEHFHGVSIGKFFFNLLMEKVGFSEGSCLSFVNLLIRLVLFPLALIMRLLFVIPDRFLSDYITLKAKRMLIENQVLENLVQGITDGVTGNKALAIPVFNSLNMALEELLLELIERPNDSEELDRLKELLSPENRELIRQGVGLAEESLNLFACETVRELDETLQQVARPKGLIKRAIQEEKANGIENVIILLHQRLTDSQYLKDSLYRLIQGLNGAFTANQMTEADQEAEFKRVEVRFFQLVNAVIAKSIQNAVRAKAAEYGLKGMGAFFEGIENKIFKIAFAEVEKVIKMGISPQFLNFVVKDALADFFVSEPES
jgi:hypothetical protein